MTPPRRSTTGGRGSVVPRAEPRTYYDQPIINEPVWTWEVPAYFLVGGTAGACAVVGATAGDRPLGRAARRAAAAGALVSPPLLISDLGRPERFLNMLRVLKPTSPMSVGSWVLAAFGPAAVGAALLEELDRLPRLGRLAGIVAAALGPALSTYTGVLIATTAVPVWHEARHELPAVFAAGSLASAGSVLAVAVPDDPAPRRLAVVGAVADLVATQVMERRLDGPAGRPYREGRPAVLARAAGVATAAGSALMALAGRRRAARTAAAGLLLAGAATQRWAIIHAGRASARDPEATIAVQRRPGRP